MADDRYWSTAGLHLLRKVLCLGVDTQRVSIQRSSREHQRIKIVGISLFYWHIDRELISFHIVVHPCDLARLGRNQGRPGSSLVECFTGLGHLNLFKVLVNNDSHAHSVQLVPLHNTNSFLVLATMASHHGAKGYTPHERIK